MHPTTLLRDDVKSEGEVKVFEALRDGLNDEWEVFHSVGWVHRDPRDGAADGEVDFVLCHPDEAIVCLEVKGGDLECRHGEWLRRGERAKDPFQQAVDHKHALARLIDEVDGWRAKGLLIVHAVSLPDVPVHSLVLGPDAPPEIVLDRNDVTEIAVALERVLAFHRGARERRRAPGPDGQAMLRELLSPTVEIRVPMAEAFVDEERQLVQLTEDQALALRRMRRNPRMAVYGCAGSGKTMLAVDHAKRVAAEGKDVLFVCFNKALGAHLHRTEAREGLRFQHFHGLCVQTIRDAGITIEWPPDEDAAAVQAFWREEVPEAFVRAIDVAGPCWDALVVDEAQDLYEHWFDALRYALRDDSVAPIWLFLDDNQRIYDGQLEVPPDFVRWELSTNCRTTQAIHRELLKLYDSGIDPDARGPEGRQPELHKATNQATKVVELLDRLLGADDVPCDHVVVLSSHGSEKSSVHAALQDRFVDDRGKARKGKVLFSSIRAFKGLESPARLSDIRCAALRRDEPCPQPLPDRGARMTVSDRDAPGRLSPR